MVFIDQWNIMRALSTRWLTFWEPGSDEVFSLLWKCHDIDQSQKAPVPNPAMPHVGREICTFFHSGELWDMGQVHCGICEIGILIGWTGVWCLAAIAGATILAPCHVHDVVKSLQLIWRSGTRRWNLRRWNLRVPNLQMSCSDLIQI